MTRTSEAFLQLLLTDNHCQRWFLPVLSLRSCNQTLYSLCGWFLSLNIMCMRFVHVVWSYGSLIFLSLQFSIAWLSPNLFILMLVDIWIVFSLWLLHIVLLGSFLHESFGICMNVFLLRVYLEVELLGHRAWGSVVNTPREFSKLVVAAVLFHFLTDIWYCVFLVVFVFMGMYW